ncbi:MAG: transposase [Patescibacteria group bacterium]|nr:transposase [Patescibacteria group bacterium]
MPKNQKQYVINHAVTLDTLGVRIDGGKNERFTLKYSKDNPNTAKVKFISTLQPGDQIFMEAGGGAERFALGCVRAGAEVFRIPTYRVHDEIKNRENGFEASGDVADEEVVERKQAKRIAALGILREFALNRPGYFYPFLEMDQKLAQIAVLANAYDMIQQKIRKPTVQRLRASVADLDIVEPIGTIDMQMYIQENLAETLFGPLRKTVKAKTNKKGEITKPEHKETFFEVLERSLKTVEEKLAYRMEQAYREMPIWDKMFKHIPGCGPVTAAKIIAGIKDIKFFDSQAKLVSAAGYDFLPDGSRRRKVRLSSNAGRAVKSTLRELYPDWTEKDLNDAIRMHHRPDLKQTVFLFTEQIRNYGQPDNPWRKAFNHRLAYEEARQEKFAPKLDGTTSYPVDRAERWLGKIFLQHIWRAWRRFEAGGEYRPYDFECLRD